MHSAICCTTECLGSLRQTANRYSTAFAVAHHLDEIAMENFLRKATIALKSAYGPAHLSTGIPQTTAPPKKTAAPTIDIQRVAIAVMAATNDHDVVQRVCKALSFDDGAFVFDSVSGGFPAKHRAH